MANAIKESDPSYKFEGSPMEATKATPLAYQQRWKLIIESLSDLQVVGLEAEVLWGRQPIEVLDPLHKAVVQLNWALGEHLRGKSNVASDQGDKNYFIVFASGNDEFGTKVSNAIDKVEKFVRPHLKA